jgi:hypothetical protein
VENIYKANAADFIKATQRIFMQANSSSGLEVEVID